MSPAAPITVLAIATSVMQILLINANMIKIAAGTRTLLYGMGHRGNAKKMTAVASSHGDPSAVSTSVAAIPIRNRPKGMKGYVYDYIMDRHDRLKNGEPVEQILTSDVWYDLVDETRNSKWAGVLAKYFKEKYGFSIKSKEAADRRTRETIISYIKDVCDEQKIRRIDVDIYAGDVGYFFFRGRRYAISLDELDNLRYLGTDILIIEKEGIAKILSPLASPSGIALLSTRGFLTENALDLSIFAQKSGANVATLTDCDISGYVIAHKVPNVPRIGINFDTLKDLGIYEDLREGEFYSPDKGHLKYAQEHIKDLDSKQLEFLCERRIEINAVKNKVGPQRLWNWIFDKLEKIYPHRNYNRAVRKPEPHWYRPPQLRQLNELVDKRLTRVLTPVITSCEHELKHYRGFITDVAAYEGQLYWSFKHLLNDNGSDVNTSGERSRTKNWLKDITDDLTTLLNKYNNGSRRSWRGA